MYTSGQFFGAGHNVQRCLRRYAADASSAARIPSCTKHPYKAGKLVPGCYFIWCEEHGHCLGFFIMPEHESPKTAFEVLYVRWLEAPKGAQILGDRKRVASVSAPS